MEGDWPKYDILAIFALAMGTFFNSNSEVERVFSVKTDIYRNLEKNRTRQEMFDTRMQIRFRAESELSFDKDSCEQCLFFRKRSHCHCSQVLVTDRMVSNFDSAYKSAPNNDNIKEVTEAEFSEKKKSELEEKEEKIKLLKWKLN